ncbi:hypothetical protein G6X41_09670, partial [Staphylococcus aureus]|nr:hypothetical protein [Staphylococcus aureus]
GYGKVAIEPIAPISWAFNAEGVNPYPYDPAQAKKLLDEAGWTPGAAGIRAKAGQPLELPLPVATKVPNTAPTPTAKEHRRQTGGLRRPPGGGFPPPGGRGCLPPRVGPTVAPSSVDLERRRLPPPG